MKQILTILFLLVSAVCFSQTAYTYNYAANPTTKNSHREVKSTIKIATTLETVTVVEGGVSAKYNIVKLLQALPEEYNLLSLSGERFYITKDYTILYAAEGYAKRVWSNMQILIK